MIIIEDIDFGSFNAIVSSGIDKRVVGRIAKMIPLKRTKARLFLQNKSLRSSITFHLFDGLRTLFCGTQ